jgi:serine/threonine-protein kinase HipA
MPRLDLDVRLDGQPEPIGKLSRDDRSNLSFSYAPAYAENETAFPLSLSLPIQDRPFNDTITRPFFDNLLQERGGVLEQVIAREGIERADIAGILFHLGKDCPGAISVLPEGAPPAKVPGNYERD